MRLRAVWKYGLRILLLMLAMTRINLYASEQTFTGIVFSNLGKQIVLQRTAQADVFINERGERFQTNHRLVVVSPLTAAQIRALDANITSIQALARLTHKSVYWLSVATDQMPAVLAHLGQVTGIGNVQPDLAPQVNTRSNKSPKKIATPDVKLPVSARMRASPICPNVSYKPRIAIIDDGFDLSNAEFSDLRPIFEYDADQYQLNASPKTQQDAHGTMVASVVFAKADGRAPDGLAPDSELIAIRQVSTWTSSNILAFSVAQSMKADLINCSWTLAFLPEPLKAVIDDMQAVEQPPYIVVAAGNTGEPACEANALTQVDRVLTVGAERPDGKRARYSNFGPCVDLYAPSGLKVISAKGLKRFGGTSASAAWVTGNIARQLQCGGRPTLRPLRMP